MPHPEENAVVQQQIERLHAAHLGIGDDQVVTYYSSEMRAESHRFGIAFAHIDGTRWRHGDCDYAFPLQSISKVFTFGLALEDNGREDVLQRVGVEPSGDPFNSISFDEANNRPLNPMINAGALVAARLVAGRDTDEKVERLLERLRLFAGNPDLRVDEQVLDEELGGNDRNLALSYLMRSLGMLAGDVDENLTVYLAMCSVRVTATDLAMMGATLANHGLNPSTHQRALPRWVVRDVISVMGTCGMYDAAGQWAFDVGIPAKSGVGGGILLTLPERFGGAFFSPGLDRHGNSVRGVNMCRDLASRFGLHPYAAPQDTMFGRREPADPHPRLEVHD